MINPAVICSTFAPSDIAMFVQENYALTSPLSCQLLKAGINHTYSIKNNNVAFVFRVYSYNWRTREEIEAELQLLQQLHNEGLSVSFPIKDNKDGYIQSLTAPEGQRFGVLFSYASGEKIQQYSSEIHFEVGKLMARIHQVTNKCSLNRIDYTPEILLEESLTYIKRFLASETAEMRFLTKTGQELNRQLLHADISQIRKGGVHLDIWFDNINISGKLVTLFDFDFCGNGWLCLDIAYYIMQLHTTEISQSERAEKIAAFYKGYLSVESISEEEMKLVQPLGVCLYFFYLGVQCRRFDDWSNVFLNETYIKRYVNQFIKKYYELNIAGT